MNHEKDFIALADAIRSVRPTRAGITEEFSQWIKERDVLALFCASQNPRFNRSRWLAYIAGECGPNGSAVKGGAK